MTTTYTHTASGGYADTLATLNDGRQMVVNTQYKQVRPVKRHTATCAQVTVMGGVCDCGLLAGVDVAALIADARVNGKFGSAPVAAVTATELPPARGLCPICETYCNGDCRA